MSLQWNSLMSLLIFLAMPVFADAQPDSCGGPTALLALIDRPTVGDSACVVPFGQAILELGLQYQSLNPVGNQSNFPEAELRIGLPANSEFVIVMPNYNTQTVEPDAGFGASVVGVKHRVGLCSKVVTSVEGLFTLPSGSDAFGSQGLGVTFNGIIAYNFTEKLNMTFMFGASNLTQSVDQGGDRYISFNPDLVISWAPVDSISCYVEVYGQSKTSTFEREGCNFDGGIVYLVSKNLSVDVEFGNRLSGNLGGFNHYVGAGLAVLFGSAS